MLLEHIFRLVQTKIPTDTVITDLDLCDNDGNFVNLSELPDQIICNELEDNPISQPQKSWILVEKEKLGIKPLLNEEFLSNRLKDKLNVLRAHAIKQNDKELRKLQRGLGKDQQKA